MIGNTSSYFLKIIWLWTCAVLADLNLPIYITPNYDHLWETLLKIEIEKSPISQVCRWNDRVSMYLKRARIKSIFATLNKYKSDPDNPLEYRLHGDMECHNYSF